MSLGINNNITALNAWRQMKTTDRNLSSSMEKLSSGLRINRAADDPAGLVISEKMRAQIVGLNAAVKNAEKAINMVSTAEASLDKVMGMLDKMRELSIDAANIGVNDQSMLAANQAELDELIDSITRIAGFTQFGTLKLLDGTLYGDTTNARYGSGKSAMFQVGPNENQVVQVDIPATQAGDLSVITANGTLSMMNTDGTTTTFTAAQLETMFGRNAADLGDLPAVRDQWINLAMLRSNNGSTLVEFNKGVFLNGQKYAHDDAVNNLTGGVSLSEGIALGIVLIDKAIEEVANVRGKLGAVQADNLQVQLDSLNVAYENLQASESTIRDADMTREMSIYTKYQIMLQAGTAMLAQANQIPNTLLKLLQ